MKKYIMILLMLIITSATFSQVVPKYDRVIDDNRDRLNEAVLRVAEFNDTSHLLYD